MVNIYADASKADDTGDGLSPATAKKTLAAAYALAITQAEAVTINVADGNYMEAGTGLVLAATPVPITIVATGGTANSMQTYPTTNGSPTALTFAANFTGTITFDYIKFAPRGTPAVTTGTVVIPTGLAGATITFKHFNGAIAGTQQRVYYVNPGFAGTLRFEDGAHSGTLNGYPILDIDGVEGMTAGNITVSGGSITNQGTGAAIWVKRSGTVIENVAVSSTGNVSLWVGIADAALPSYYTDDVTVRGVRSYLTAASAHGIMLGGGSRRPLVERCYSMNTGATAYGFVDKSIDGIVQDSVFIAPSGTSGGYLWKGAQRSTVRRNVIACAVANAVALRTDKGTRIGGAGQDQDAVDTITFTDNIVCAGSGSLYSFGAGSYAGYAATGCRFSGAAGANAPDQSTWPLTTNAWSTAGLPTATDDLAQVARPAVSKRGQGSCGIGF